jgi:hypothetical protein
LGKFREIDRYCPLAAHFSGGRAILISMRFLSLNKI